MGAIRRAVKATAVLTTLFVVLLFVWEICPENRSLVPGPPPWFQAELPEPESVSYVPRLHVLYADVDGVLYGMEDHFLYTSHDDGATFQRRGALPKAGSAFQQAANRVARSKLVRQIRHNRGPTSMEVLSSGTIVVFYDRIYRSTDGGDTFHAVFDPAVLGVNGVFKFGVGTAVGQDDTLYAGEYNCAKRPHVIRVLRGTVDGSHWEIAYEFDSGAIFHIHSITYDPYRAGYWVCTGDLDEESALYFTTDFQTLEMLGGGSQDWRIVSLIVTPDSLYWGSDNDRPEGAAIFRWSFEREQVEKVQDIGKVSYYATQLADGTLAISTTYEPDSRYTATASPRPSSEVWISRNGESWARWIELVHEPMRLPTGRRARAQIAFPGGRPLDRLFLIPRYTAGDPFGTVVVKMAPGKLAGLEPCSEGDPSPSETQQSD